MIVSLLSDLASLGLKLYNERNDKHEQIVKEWEELQRKAADLDSLMQANRRERDAATLKKLDELEARKTAALSAALAVKVP